MPSRVLPARAIASALAIALIPGLVSAEDRTQRDIREQFGGPDAFSIFYFDEPAADGSTRTVTVSQWLYFDDGLEFTFEDDQVVAEDSVALKPGVEVEPVPYDPDQFQAYMSLEEILTTTGLEHYLGGPVGDLVDGGELFFADRLTWGLKGGELRYLEAVALEAEVAGEEAE